MIEARFDDLSPEREHAFRFAEPVGVVEARRPDEVEGAISAAASAAERGFWVGGFVAYEAAPGLDPDLVTRVRSGDDPFADLPLVWFSLFERSEDVAPLEPAAETGGDDGRDSPWRPSVDRSVYDAAIDQIRSLIGSGETYQVNHTLRLRARISGDERGLYRDLVLAQRGGFSAYLNLGRYRVLSASPELFFRVEGERITTRPMKGTAARGRWLEEDEAVAAALVASEKERAENAMIVDLLRNDLGRIARPGSVEVAAMFEPERYETVWQLTSTVAADLPSRTPLVEVFRALFPSGSVTGAPKVAAMRIIAALEDDPRGVYCGAIGYLAPTGSGAPAANFNVGIRTVALDTEGGTAEYGAGGGITFGSSAAAEYEEVLAKAKILTVGTPSFGLFETLRHERTRGFRHLDEHLARLGASARYFGFRFAEEDALAALKAAADEGTGELLRVRVTLARDGGIVAEASELAPEPERPVRIALDAEPVDPSDPWLFHKTTRRSPYVRRRARRPDVDDVVLVNTRGEATESTIANLAVLLDGTWVTPPLEAGLLPGTYRSVLLREGRLVERPVTEGQLRTAPAVALVSSVRGWRKAQLVP